MYRTRMYSSSTIYGEKIYTITSQGVDELGTKSSTEKTPPADKAATKRHYRSFDPLKLQTAVHHAMKKRNSKKTVTVLRGTKRDQCRYPRSGLLWPILHQKQRSSQHHHRQHVINCYGDYSYNSSTCRYKDYRNLQQSQPLHRPQQRHSYVIRKLQIKTCYELDRHRRRHRENNMKSGVPTFLFGILLLRTGDAKGELHRIIYLRARKHHQQQQQARKQPSTNSTKAQEPRKDRIPALPIRSTSSSTSIIAAIIIIAIIIYSSCSTIAVYPRSFHASIATKTRGGRTLSAPTATRIATRTRARWRLCLCLIYFLFVAGCVFFSWHYWCFTAYVPLLVAGFAFVLVLLVLL